MKIRTIHCQGKAAKVIIGPPGQQKRHWSRGAFYEPKLLRYIRATYKGGTFVDVGSSLGNHTLFFAKFCRCRHVLSVEPVADSVELQRQILELNEVESKVTIVNVALSDEEGTGRMVQFGPNVGQMKLEPGDEVTVETLDGLLERLDVGRVTLVKLDVEYHELRVLMGARKLLKEQHPAVFGEFNEDSEVARASKFLKRFGYRRGSFFHPTMYEFIWKGTK